MSTPALEAVRVFPPEVHESLAALRIIAKAAVSKDDPTLRRATPDEIALSEQLAVGKCTGHSNRTGLACTKFPLRGLNVCQIHGGKLRHVKRKLLKRLAEASPKSLENMIKIGAQDDDLNSAVRANIDLLDRFGFGAAIQAKIRASKRQDTAGTNVTVNIGFIG